MEVQENNDISIGDFLMEKGTGHLFVFNNKEDDSNVLVDRMSYELFRTMKVPIPKEAYKRIFKEELNNYVKYEPWLNDN